MSLTEVAQHSPLPRNGTVPFRASGRGALLIGDRRFDDIDYFVTTVDGLELEIVGFVFVNVDEGGVLSSMRGKSAILCFGENQRLHVQLARDDYLHVGSAPPICFFFTADSLAVPPVTT